MIRRFVILWSVLFFSASAVQAQPSRPVQRGTSPRDTAGAMQRLEARVAQLNASHADLVAKLNKIQKHIKSNEQEEALAACQAFLAGRTTEHKEQLKTLERQLDYLKRMSARRARTGRRVTVGQQAHRFQAKTLTGETVNLNQQQGKVIVLEWINFACPYSRYHYKTKKTMIELANRYESQGVVWVAVNSTHTVAAEDYQAFLKSIGLDSLPYPVVDDREGKIGRAYGAKVTPQIVIVDKAGKIAYSGSVDNAPQGKTRPEGAKTINYVDRALSELVSGRPVSTLETELMGCTVKYASPGTPGASRSD